MRVAAHTSIDDDDDDGGAYTISLNVCDQAWGKEYQVMPSLNGEGHTVHDSPSVMNRLCGLRRDVLSDGLRS